MPSKKNAKAVEPQMEEDEKTNETGQNAQKELLTIPCNEFDIKRLYMKALQAQKEATQLMCYPRYMYDLTKPLTPESFEKYGDYFVVITPPIKIFKGGIPRHNEKSIKFFGPDPESTKRAYFYIPKDEKNPETMQFFNMCHMIDEYMIDEINTKENNNGIISILNSKGRKQTLKGITYKRMITKAEPTTQLGEDEEDNEDDDPKSKKNSKKGGGKDKENNNKKTEFEPWERVKVKFATLFDENLAPTDNKEIITQIFVGDKEEPEPCKKLTDFEKHFMFGCTARFALQFNKVWIMKTDKKLCSFGIKCIQICVTEQPEKRGTAINKFHRKLFGNSAPLVVTAAVDNEQSDAAASDDDETNNSSSKKNSSSKLQTSTKSSKSSKKNDSDSDSDNNDAENNEDKSDNNDNDNDNNNNEAEKSEQESDDDTPPPPSKAKNSSTSLPKDVTVKGKATKNEPVNDKKGATKKPARK